MEATSTVMVISHACFVIHTQRSVNEVRSQTLVVKPRGMKLSLTCRLGDGAGSERQPVAEIQAHELDGSIGCSP